MSDDVLTREEFEDNVHAMASYLPEWEPGGRKFVIDKWLAHDAALRARLAAAEKALEEIKREQGKVCENFELCGHRACQSSYESWAIADRALAEIRRKA